MFEEGDRQNNASFHLPPEEQLHLCEETMLHTFPAHSNHAG